MYALAIVILLLLFCTWIVEIIIPKTWTNFGFFPSFRCEGFSTYPRTYDLLHANRLFTLYQDK